MYSLLLLFTHEPTENWDCFLLCTYTRVLRTVPGTQQELRKSWTDCYLSSIEVEVPGATGFITGSFHPDRAPYLTPPSVAKHRQFSA